MHLTYEPQGEGIPFEDGSPTAVDGWSAAIDDDDVIMTQGTEAAVA